MIYLDNAATSYPKPESVLRAQVITTPRAVSLGCGLSVRFPVQDMPVAAQVYRANPLHNLIGFYIAREQGGSLQVSPAPL